MTGLQREASARPVIAVALGLLLTVLWLGTHRYQGLHQDARLYAMQALARLTPGLKNDLYLQDESQDRFTVFSPFYAAVIRLVGLTEAARLLTVAFTAWFLAAAYALARPLLARDEAWLASLALILTAGVYGSYGIFSFSEDYLTARLPAEALIATALALHYRGSTWSALSMASAALLVHPLMAFPGLILLILLSVPVRVGAGLICAGIASALAVALCTLALPRVQRVFPVLDAGWLYVVRERSQFLFIRLWSLHDWEINLRPFVSLALTASVFTDARVRKLSVASALVGASGLAVAATAGAVSPVAILLQGQPWRWTWITAFIGAALMVPTALRLWRDARCGPLCVVLLATAWTVSEFHAPLLAFAALALFLVRSRISAEAARYLRWAALALCIAILCWTAGAFFTNRSLTSGGDALRLPLLIAAVLTWHYLRRLRSNWLPAVFCSALVAPCVALSSQSLRHVGTIGSPSEILEFADWRRAIPSSANVYVADGRDAASFTWFTLARPSYLSLDQSAGVIFSRATALEVQRRSAVLLPLMSEDWKLLSRNAFAGSEDVGRMIRRTPLTASSLAAVCSDPQLDFLIAREDVGFDPIRHRHSGAWKDWNLYDCAHVRSLAPAF